MNNIAYLEGECSPFRCPSCGGIVANRKSEGWIPDICTGELSALEGG